MAKLTLGKKYRETIKKNLKSKIENTPSVFILHYKGLLSPEISQLRKELSKLGARISVVKNTLTSSVLEDLQLKDLSNGLNRPTAFVFGTDDSITISKALFNFAKEHERLEIGFAYVEKRVLDKNRIKELSMLPPKEVLIAKVIGGIKSPLNGLANVLSGNLRKIVIVLNEIAKNKTK